MLWKECKEESLDFSAIATFLALGFMLDDDTFYKKIKVCRPFTKYEINNQDKIISQEKMWEWHYSPKEKPFNIIFDEFSDLFEELVLSGTKDNNILLPISGGIDSRTLFVPMKENLSKLTLYAYEYEGGHNESQYGRKLAENYNLPFYSQTISSGYLWDKLDLIADLNNCFTDFTHPRQIAAIQQMEGLGDVILLGHWGDVLFDKQADSDATSFDEQVIQLKKKMIKPGGIELANDLWKYWDLEGSFDSYISDRLDKLYSRINIAHASARIRAFKSLYWAPRWTSINLSIFSQLGNMVLPYYSDEMCKFICTVPERHLNGRKIQIEYIKKYCPEAAQISWQKFHPLNLYQYQRFNQPQYYFVRAIKKTNRIFQRFLSKSSYPITRNWELHFLGERNFIQLRKKLLGNNNFNEFVPKFIIKKYLDNFQTNPVKYAHPLSMLLTLAVFSNNNNLE